MPEDAAGQHRIRLGGGSPVPCGEDQSLLEAFLRADVWLPHSCTQGSCGTCKVRVVDGEVDHRDTSEYTLTPEERGAGVALGCQAAARSDLVVEPLEKVDDSAPKHRLRDVVGTVTALDDIARDVRRVLVALDEPLEFSAGQYAEVTVPGAGVARQYSMANPPSRPDVLEFHVKRTPGGVATDGWVFRTLAVGERIRLTGPLGRFGMPERPGPAILVAGGTGLAPLKSLVEHALQHGLAPELHLYHGGRDSGDLYDEEFFRDLERTCDRFHYRPCLETGDGNRGEATGLVTDAVLDEFRSCKGYSGYLCGPPAMVQAGVRAFKRRRMAPKNIHREEFVDASHDVRGSG